MGKITVKHYLEKKVKPTMIHGGIIAYPVYVRITVNRKTTQLKSLTDALMSEAAFERYKQSGTVDFQESMCIDTVNYFMGLSEEPSLIRLCMETIILHDEDYDFSDRHTREQLGLLLTSTREAFIKSAWKQETYAALQIEAFIGSFNRKMSLINSIKLFQDVLHIDITKHIPSEYFKMWQVVELVKCLQIKERPFVEFINVDFQKQLIDASKNQKYRDYCLITDNHTITESEIYDIASGLKTMYLLGL
jgi:hypothetical protein